MEFPTQNDWDLVSGHLYSFISPLRLKRTSIDSQEVPYLEGGKGKTLVFLHGLGSAKSQARSVLQGLVKYFRVIAVDISGLSWGVSLPGQKRHTLKNLSQWLNQFLDKVSVPSCYLVGHSSGSALAAYFAGTNPEKVEKLLLMALPDLLTEPAVMEISKISDFSNRT